MEYLMTYGWALLVIVIVIAILLAINPFSAPQGCRFDQIGFICENPVIDTGGNLYMKITNANNNAINVQGVTCTSDKSPTPPEGACASGPMLQRQETYAITKSSHPVSCKDADGNTISLPAGTDFSGKIWFFYKNDGEGADYPCRSVSATLSTKIVKDTATGTTPPTCSGATPVWCAATSSCVADASACTASPTLCGASPLPAGMACCGNTVAYNSTTEQCCGPIAGDYWKCAANPVICGVAAPDCTSP